MKTITTLCIVFFVGLVSFQAQNTVSDRHKNEKAKTQVQIKQEEMDKKMREANKAIEKILLDVKKEEVLLKEDQAKVAKVIEAKKNTVIDVEVKLNKDTLAVINNPIKVETLKKKGWFKKLVEKIK